VELLLRLQAPQLTYFTASPSNPPISPLRAAVRQTSETFSHSNSAPRRRESDQACGNQLSRRDGREKIPGKLHFVKELAHLLAGGVVTRARRVTPGFSKRLDNIKHAVALLVAHYNFCRVHGSHSQTPAQKSELTAEAWTIERLLTEAS